MVSAWMIGLCFCMLQAPATERTSSAADIDLGLFARVVSSDPVRSDGARAGRLEEFRVEDVFLTTELAPQPDGTYTVPNDRDTGGAIGLEWPERRVLQQLVLDSVAPRAVTVTPVLEYWSSSGREDAWGSIGQTPWQGRWESLPAQVELNNGRYVATISQDAIPEFRGAVGVLKIRWRFSADAGSMVVQRPQAFGSSTWRTDTLCIETETPSDLTVHVYNGLLVDAIAGSRVLSQTVTTPRPGALGRDQQPTLCEQSRPYTDAFSAPERHRHGCRRRCAVSRTRVCPGRGFVRAPGGLADDLALYREQMADKKTILARVREMPDQSFDQALESLWRPVQNSGPTMLSLACDNAKFIVDREGMVRCDRFSLRPRFPVTAVDVIRLDFGALGIDTTVRPSPTATALPLRIADQTYAKGIGLHANAELAVFLDGKYAVFEAEVGVLPSDQSGGTVIFQVGVDGQRQYDSGIVRQGETPRIVRVDVSGAKQLTLHVTDAGDGILNDAANWAQARLVPVVGPGKDAPVFLSDLYAGQARPVVTRARTLEGRWLPIVVNTCQLGSVALRQRTWVAPCDDSNANWDGIGKTQAIGVAEFTVENTGDVASDISFRLDPTLLLSSSDDKRVNARTVGQRVLWTADDQLLAVLDLAGAEPLEAHVDSAGVYVTGKLPASKSASHFIVYIPAWRARLAEQSQFPSPQKLTERVTRYWQEMLGTAMQIEVPEPLLEDVYRATQVHCLMAARNEADGQRVAPWIASDAYGPLDTEAQPVILGMDLVGHGEFARRSLDFFISSYNADGLARQRIYPDGHGATSVDPGRASRDPSGSTVVGASCAGDPEVVPVDHSPDGEDKAT